MVTPRDLDLLVYDFDGVMTDNRCLVLQDGTEAVFVNRGDGLGVDQFRQKGIPQVILSTETNPVVAARGRKLRIEVIQSCGDKRAALAEYCRRQGHSLDRVVFLGNDVNDLDAMKSVGYPAAPSDAHPSVLAVARIRLSRPGGTGVIRELAEVLLGA